MSKIIAIILLVGPSQLLADNFNFPDESTLFTYNVPLKQHLTPEFEFVVSKLRDFDDFPEQDASPVKTQIQDALQDCEALLARQKELAKNVWVLEYVGKGRLGELREVLEFLDHFTTEGDDYITTFKGVEQFLALAAVVVPDEPQAFIKRIGSGSRFGLSLVSFTDLAQKAVPPQFELWFGQVNETMSALIESLDQSNVKRMDQLVTIKRLKSKQTDEDYDAELIKCAESFDYATNQMDGVRLERNALKLSKDKKTNAADLAYETVKEVCDKFGADFYEQMTKFVVARFVVGRKRARKAQLNDEFHKLKTYYRMCASILGPEHRDKAENDIRHRKKSFWEKMSFGSSWVV